MLTCGVNLSKVLKIGIIRTLAQIFLGTGKNNGKQFVNRMDGLNLESGDWMLEGESRL